MSEPRLQILTKYGDDWVNIFLVIAKRTNRQTRKRTNEQTNILGKIYDFCQVIINVAMTLIIGHVDLNNQNARYKAGDIKS